MSILKSVESFFSKAWKELTSIFSNPKTITAVKAALNMAAPLVEEIVTLVGGAAAGDAVTLLINKIESDYLTVSTVISNVVNTPSATELQTIINALNSIKTSLPQLLSVANVSNSTTLATVENNVALIINEAEALLAVFQATTSTVSTTTVTTPTVATPVNVLAQTPAPEPIQLTGVVKKEQL